MVVLRLFSDFALCRFEARPGFDFDEALADLRAAVPSAIWRDGWWRVRGDNRLLLLAHVFRTFDARCINLDVCSALTAIRLC